VSETTPPLVAPTVDSRARSVAVYAMVVISGVLLLLTTFAVWVDRVALNTGVFADTSSELIEDDTIRAAVASRAVDELYDSVDVEKELEGPLPEDVESLAGPTSATLRQLAPGIVERALEQPALQRLWYQAVKQSHAALVDVLEERSGTVSTEEGVVTLDLGDIVREAADRIGVSESVERRIGPDAGRIVLLRSDDLDTAQDGFRTLKALAWILPLLTLVVFALTLWIAGARRRVTVRALGIAVFVSGLLGLLAVRLVGSYLVDQLATDRQSREAGDHAWAIVTELLRGSFRLQIAIGIVFVLAAWAVGPSERAVAVRRAFAPALRERRYAYGALAVIALLLVFTGRANDFARVLAELVLIALLAVWIEWMRRVTLAEFPQPATPARLGDARIQLSALLQRRPASAPPETPRSDVTAQLRELAELHAGGQLTDEEYAAAKAKVLSEE
jgi:Short C-terminal domain